MWTLEVTLRTWKAHSLTCARPSQQLYQAPPITERMPERISMRAGHKLLATNLHMCTKQKHFYYSPWRQPAPESKQIPENQNTHSQNVALCYPHYYSKPKLLQTFSKNIMKTFIPEKIELLVLVLILILFFPVGWPVVPWRPVVHLKEIQKSRLVAWSWWRGIPINLSRQPTACSHEVFSILKTHYIQMLSGVYIKPQDIHITSWNTLLPPHHALSLGCHTSLCQPTACRFLMSIPVSTMISTNRNRQGIAQVDPATNVVSISPW